MAATVNRVLAGASLAALGFAACGPAAYAAAGASGIGAIRTPAGEFANGIDFFVSETLRYESNLVRTADDQETLQLYQTTDTADLVSVTEANAELALKRDRSKLSFKGHLGYELYTEFDEFSGVFGGASGNYEWQFTQRCSTNLNAGVEYALASFNKVNRVVENRQTRVSANIGAGCFILDRVRLSADLFGGTIDNDENSLKPNDLNYKGYQTTLAYVTAKQNEIGVRYQKSTTERPNLDVGGNKIPDQDNQRYELLGKYHIGEKLKIGGGIGVEVQDDGSLGDDTNRTYTRFDLSWFPSDRLAVGLDFARGIEDLDDLSGATTESDKYGASVNWKFHPRATLGAFAKYEDDTLRAQTDNPFTPLVNESFIFPDSVTVLTPGGVAINGIEEKTLETGVSLRHGLAGIVDVIWTLGYVDRSSDYAKREYDGMSASVTLGAKF